MTYTEGYSLFIGNRIRREMKVILIILAVCICLFTLLTFLTKTDREGIKLFTHSGMCGGLFAGMMAFISGSCQSRSKYGKEDCFFVTMKNRFQAYKGYYVGMYILMASMFTVLSVAFDTLLFIKGCLENSFVATLVLNIESVLLIMGLSPFMHSIRNKAACYLVTLLLTMGIKISFFFLQDSMTQHILLLILLGLIATALPFISIPCWFRKMEALYESE